MNVGSKKLAKELDGYVRFRAVREGIGYSLSPEFFAEGFEDGCVCFFGIHVSEEGIIRDEQQPLLLAEWRSSMSVPLQ